MYLHQHSVPVFPLKSDATPIVVTDSNGNYFLIALTSQSTEHQRTNNMPESKAADQVTLQVQNIAEFQGSTCFFVTELCYLLLSLPTEATVYFSQTPKPVQLKYKTGEGLNQGTNDPNLQPDSD